jgi:hypothetical protein
MGCFYSFTLIDSHGRTTKRVIQAVEVALKADQITDLEATIDDLEAITDLGLVRADIIYTAAGTPFAVTEDSNVDVGATFTGVLYNKNGKKASIKVPGIKMEFAELGVIAPSQEAIAAWLDRFVEDTPHNLMCSDGETMESWTAGSLDR